jgi:hypothetical protein
MSFNRWRHEKCSNAGLTPSTSFGKEEGVLEAHVKIYKDFQEIVDLHSLSICLPLRYDFGVAFEVVIPERENLENVSSEQDAIVYCTDGSRKDGRTGIGIYGPSVRHFEPLGSTPTICQAEMYNDNKPIFIMSDSQAAL